MERPMSESLEARLAQAVEQARDDARYSCDREFSAHDALIARYGDLRAAQGRWEQHVRYHIGTEQAHCELEADIEALIGGGP